MVATKSRNSQQESAARHGSNQPVGMGREIQNQGCSADTSGRRVVEIELEICHCGEIKQRKSGTYTENAVDYCNNCRKPADVKAAMAASGYTVDSVTDHLMPVKSSRVTTLHELPGHRITEVQGVVSMLGSASGWTASSKGNNALNEALIGLRQAAAQLGGNAIVGLTSSTFGARGGVTSVVGGDAVGVLLVGTAVTVEVQNVTITRS